MRKWNDDPFTKKAQREDFLARSIYKLEEIDKREKLFNGVTTVVDLGASPGSWTQYCLKRLPANGKLVAIDLAPIKVSDPRLTFVQAGIETTDIASLLGGAKADLVLSDMAPKTSGIHDRDVALSFELADLALKVACENLKKSGSFVVKIFMGDTFEEYDAQLKKSFENVKRLRPDSTRKHSREIYFIAKGFRGL